MPPKVSNGRALRIMASAREEFARRGFDGARVDEIARGAGVNKQLLFYYYHSKRGLFHAVLSQAATDLEHALAAIAVASGRPLERLRQALEAQFEFLAQNPDVVTLLVQAGRSDVRPFAPAVKRLVVLLAEGQGRGDFLGGLGTRSLAGDVRDLFDLHPNNTFLVKASYWMNW